MNRCIRNTILAAAACLATWLVAGCTSTSPEGAIKIAILQTASHPALDAARTGFMAELERLHDEPITWIVQNAEGAMSQLATSAKSYGADPNIAMVYAIGSPAVQMVDRMAPDKILLYAAVSDPDALGLGRNACGTSDRVDAAAQAALVREMLPDAGSVHILLNLAENNSEVQVAQMVPALEAVGLTVHTTGVQLPSEIAAAVSRGAQDADLLLIPTDNLLVSAMPLVAKTALKHRVPVIASDTPSVTKGALAARGVNYTDCGMQTARIAHRLLTEAVTPAELGTVHPENNSTVVNTDTAEALELSLPSSVLDAAQLVKLGGSIPCR